MPNSLKIKLAEIVRAEDSAMELLTHQYPIGTVIECWLMYGQKRPSKGTVISYSGGRYGVINVKLDSRKQKVCPVPASKIVENGA